MTEAYICDYIRTPIGRYGGALSAVRADDLGAVPLKALMARNTSVDWEAVDDVIFGNANDVESRIHVQDFSRYACRQIRGKEQGCIADVVNGDIFAERRNFRKAAIEPFKAGDPGCRQGADRSG